MNFQEAGIRFGIDSLQLELEWQNHPQMVINAAQVAADRQRDFDFAKQNAEYESSRLKNDVRSNPGDYINGKVTESSIDDAVTAHPDYRLAQKAMIEAKHAMNLADGTSLALEHKKSALSKMVDLWIHEYYSDPTNGRAKTEDRFELRRRGLSKQDEGGDAASEGIDGE